MKIGINGRHLGPNKTGVGRYLISLLQEWQRDGRGHEFHVYVSNERLGSDDEALFTPRSPIRLRRVPRPLGSFHIWYNFTLPQAMVRDQIDWFFSPDYFCPPTLPHRIRRSLTIHDVSYLAHPEWFSLLYRWYGRLYSKRPAQTADLVFAVSEFSRSEILRYTRADPNRIVVTHEAADPKFRPDSGTQPQLEGLTGPYFLYVGKIFNRRHLRELIQAFDQYLESPDHQEFQLVIRGHNETKPFQDIEGMIRTINGKYGRRAVLIPTYLPDEQLIRLYQRALGFFYLSTYEGFGLPVLEALACGTPTVAVRATSIPEVAGEAAVYVDPTDVNALQRVMERLTDDSAWTADLRQQSIQQAQKFSWTSPASLTLQAIERSYGT